MNDMSTLRLSLLRAMYLLLVVGLGLTMWPTIIAPPAVTANAGSVVRSLLGALCLLSLLGLRYPLRMLPLLLFELAWKIIWVVAFALPMWMGPGLDAYAAETLFACVLGIVLVPLVLPWGYIAREYVRAPGTPWSASVR
ncbi:hypothetical protein F2P44_16395 [Massilia sp. CCM 8695]|uniref:Uncharacterized protein n=1 Tax=Massilia frigida TaxID=2609281 RepID=A0ABX0NEA3_9BURK|nr:MULTISPECIES: hypothetical protein [Massilia]MDM5177434.1 hypothetical protein [Massilia sp. DJPM01]NHZ80842.1 hypothetical protein [Massilia frigida]